MIKSNMMTQEEISAILGDISMERNVFDIVKDLGSAIRYLNCKGLCSELLREFAMTLPDSYSSKLTAYRIVIAALTNNEERHLTTGERWFPVVQFCKPGKEHNCIGNEIIGTIESEGQKYTVVGGDAINGSNAGLGFFNSSNGVSCSYVFVGFQSVSSKEVAEHISKYFGKLLFDIHYGGTNCDWKWLIS